MIPEVKELEKLREELGYSQEDVARILDVSPASYQNWVYKEHEPTYKNLKKIMRGKETLKERTNKKGQKVPTGEELEKRKEENSDNVEVVDYGSRR